MVTNSIIDIGGKNVLLYRTYTENADLSATQFLAPTKFKVGINSADLTVADTDVTLPVPIANGTIIDNGSNTLTGSFGGDDTTDNTTTYKEGAGQTDAQSQNLLTDAGAPNIQKTWSKTGLTIYSDRAYSCWIYIKDLATISKLNIIGTALRLEFLTSTDNGYYQDFTINDLSVGWNYLTSNKLVINQLSALGTPSTLTIFRINIYTVNATDAFAAGDVLYDLCRQWQAADLIKSFSTGYPAFDYVNSEVTTRCYLTTIEANGFLLDSLGIFNEDTVPILLSSDKTAGDSKSSTDEFGFLVVDRVV